MPMQGVVHRHSVFPVGVVAVWLHSTPTTPSTMHQGDDGPHVAVAQGVDDVQRKSH